MPPYMQSMNKSTIVHAILVYSEDIRRWKNLIGKENTEIKAGNRLGIRIYLKDKYRWSKIIKKEAIKDKIAADVFKEMLDLVERRKHQLRNKKVADIFKYLLDLYEREMLLWGKI